MLELYNNTNSVCAQKVRLALTEKDLRAKEHMLKLQGDQFDPAYLKLNPNGVVPTLVHDGQPITESAVILYYLEDAFPQPPLMPAAPADRARVHMFNKLIDEYMHHVHYPHIRHGLPPTLLEDGAAGAGYRIFQISDPETRRVQA
jgi:glutathione S-transferase